ncbi:MAG TPA: hypothetical protein VD858_10135, partial [Reyranella sp.]|nr:hypothetical protein [Reyranella sp.]
MNRLLALGFRLCEGHWGGNRVARQVEPRPLLKPKTQSLKPVAASVLVAALFNATPALAQYAAGPQRPNPVNEKAGILKSIGIDQKIGQQLPLDTMFKNEVGRDVRLGEFFNGRPVVLALAYYDCPMLCTQVLNG